MNTLKLKLALVKIAKVSATVASIGLITTGISSYAIQFLPPEAYTTVMDLVNASKATLNAYGLGATLSGAGLVVGTQGVKLMANSQSVLELQQKAFETDIMKKIDTRYKLQENLDDKVVEKQNIIIAQNAQLIKQQATIIAYETISAKRNAENPLVPAEVQNLYKAQLAKTISDHPDIKPIVKVIERTVEVIKEVPQKRSERL